MIPSRLVALQLPGPGDGGAERPLVPVGVERSGGAAAATLVVKATFALVGSGAARTLRLASVQRPILAQSSEPADLAPPVGADLAPGSSVVVPTDGGRFEIVLPRWVPRVFRTTPGGDDAQLAFVLVPIRLACDEVRADPAAELAEIVWRGSLADPAAVDLLVLAIDDDRSAEVLAGELARARPQLVAERGATDATLDDAALAEARAALWDAPAPAPRTTLATYARISAELAERREPAAVTLARHGFDEDRWMQEERGWLDAVAAGAERGDATLAAELGEHFAAAQRALAASDEGRRTLSDYAAIRVALERTADPVRVLEARGLSLPAWMRLDTRWTEAADADARVAGELELRLAEARAQLGPEAADDAALADEETETAS